MSLLSVSYTHLDVYKRQAFCLRLIQRSFIHSLKTSQIMCWKIKFDLWHWFDSVSYTHLDVYKRQVLTSAHCVCINVSTSIYVILYLTLLHNWVCRRSLLNFLHYFITLRYINCKLVWLFCKKTTLTQMMIFLKELIKRAITWTTRRSCTTV